MRLRGWDKGLLQRFATNMQSINIYKSYRSFLSHQHVSVLSIQCLCSNIQIKTGINRNGNEFNIVWMLFSCDYCIREKIKRLLNSVIKNVKIK
jgi:hypothetical protein